MKRALSILLAAVFLLSLVPAGVVELTLTAAADTEGYYTYTVTDGEATITDVDAGISGDVVIPSALGGYPVTSIGYMAFYNCDLLQSVTIPVGVTSIENRAFYDCGALASVTIPAGVSSIGESTFHYCTSLRSVTIPDSVTSIGESAFLNCWSLPSVTIPNSVTSIGGRVFNNCDALTSVTIPGSVTSIGSNAFRGCSALETVTIGDGVTSIGGAMFYDCTSLQSVTIPGSVTSIGSSAFGGCTALTSVAIPDGVTSIGSSAFSGCTALTSVTISDSVTDIGNSVFFQCFSFTDVYYGGDETDRAKITVGSDNTKLTSATWHYTCKHRNTAVNGYVAPTCTEDGYTGDTVCADCGEMLAENAVIPATGHTEVIKGAVDATTSAEGYTGDVVCDVCDVLLEEGAVIPAKVASIVNGRYYEDGVKVPYAGLVLVDGNYYYVGDNAKIVKGRFFASRFNGFTQFKNGYYYFDENGVMNTQKAVFDGYYYDEIGRGEAYAGLVEVNGAYYYVLEKGEAVVGRYAIVKTNDLKVKGIYCFDVAGKMVTNTVVDGRYYGVSGLSESYLGLVKASDGNLYYVQAQGKVVVNAERFLVSKTNGLVTKGYYAFDENGALTALKVPTAEVNEATEYVNAPIKWENFGAYTPKDPDQQLEAVYKFKAQDDATTIATSPYKDWICDYYVMMDRDVPEGAVVLGGNYGTWGWIGFNNPVAVDANVEVPLLGSVTQNPWTYQMVVENVGEFLCGVAHVDPALDGATFTVMLRLTNPDNEAEYYNVNTVTYTF